MATLAQADARRRITLPPASGIKAGDPLQMDVLEDGRVLITPVVTIPRSQVWSWRPEVQQKVADSITDPRPSICLSTPGSLEGLAAQLGIDPIDLE